jgi:hypothetical protein
MKRDMPTPSALCWKSKKIPDAGTEGPRMGAFILAINTSYFSNTTGRISLQNRDFLPEFFKGKIKIARG